MDYEEKFIAFIDILGFSNFVEHSVFSLDELLRFTTLLNNEDEYKFILEYGPIVCPDSNYRHKNLNFEVKQISDCLISSSEISASGLINIIKYSWTSLFKLMKKGIMCRGYITKGLIHHKNGQIIGPGYQKAVKKEKAEIKAFQKENDSYSTPFVEIDSIIKNFVKHSNDDCLKKQFDRLTRSKDKFTVLFPFKQFSYLAESYISSADFKSKEANEYTEIVRNYIREFKAKLEANIENANEKAKQKANYYLEFLDEQIDMCNRLDKEIKMLNSPFPRWRIEP